MRSHGSVYMIGLLQPSNKQNSEWGLGVFGVWGHGVMGRGYMMENTRGSGGRAAQWLRGEENEEREEVSMIIISAC